KDLVPCQVISPRNSLLPLFFLLCAYFYNGCAGELPPSGGPVDTVPPRIIATFPEPNTVGFSGSKVILEFDEYVEEQSVEGSVFISPFLGLLEFDWSGRQVQIRFAEKLRPTTTYVVNVGTDVVDIRNRNRMDRAFSLAFSTGASIDSGSISGRVFDNQPEGVMVFAYRLDSLSSRLLDPSIEKPHYITQTGKGGSFSLTHLSLGPYRLFAVRDEYKNLLYDTGVDEVGMYRGDVALDSAHPSFGGVDFQLTKEDTTRPQLFSASALDQQHVVLRFSKPLDPNRFTSRTNVVVDTLSGERLGTRDGFVDLQNPSSLVLLTSDQKPQIGYRITVDSLFDTTGNVISQKMNSAVFQGAGAPDTSSPEVIYISVRDSARQVPLDARLECRFNDIVRRQNISQAFLLLDSTGSAVKATFRWKTSAAFEFVPATELRSKEWYQIRLPLSAVVDLAGNHGKESLLVRRFETIDKNQMGSIEGEVVDETGSKRRAPVIVRASEVRQKERAVYEVRLPEAGKFQMSRIVEGSYVVSGFRDDDHDGKFSIGKPFPFQSSEVFAFYPDTVRVRARWPVQGVVIRLR
ncbi:MAG: Ig-like domain-containing protein, partial [Bacteroidota bacterium]